ncbi:unnamed protein product [Caenorhabditis sp. 36 PRJEB53466]|nr:unnamed protein product [Caenorhabditis sp. 36 PRJEB53466]
MNVYSVFVFAVLAISSVSAIGYVKGGSKGCGGNGGGIIIGSSRDHFQPYALGFAQLLRQVYLFAILVAGTGGSTHGPRHKFGGRGRNGEANGIYGYGGYRPDNGEVLVGNFHRAKRNCSGRD